MHEELLVKTLCVLLLLGTSEGMFPALSGVALAQSFTQAGSSVPKRQ